MKDKEREKKVCLCVCMVKGTVVNENQRNVSIAEKNMCLDARKFLSDKSSLPQKDVLQLLCLHLVGFVNLFCSILFL